MDTEKRRTCSLYTDGNQGAQRNRFPFSPQNISESCYSRRLDQSCDWQTAQKFLFKGQHQINGSEGITSDLEEAIFHTDCLEVQQFLPDLYEAQFKRVTRRHIGFAQFPLDRLQLRQSLKINFADRKSTRLNS